MSVIVLQIQGDQALIGALRGIERAVEDQREPIAEIGTEGLGLIARRFEHAGPGWQRLAKSTEIKKARRIGGPSRILVDSGRLLGSFSKGTDDNINRVEALRGEFGSTVPYGIFHQEGRGVPKREIIPADFEKQAGEQFGKIIIKHNTQKFEALGFEVK